MLMKSNDCPHNEKELIGALLYWNERKRGEDHLK